MCVFFIPTGIVVVYLSFKCSTTSEKIAEKGNNEKFLQISFSATSDSLSEVDTYNYFARTVAPNMAQGIAVANLLENLGLVPYVTVVYFEDGGYSVGLKDHFVDAWTVTDHHVVLREVEVEEYHMDEVVAAIAASGAPVVVLFLYADQVNEFFEVASSHHVSREQFIFS